MLIFEECIDFLNAVAYHVKQLVHEFGFLHFRYVGDDLLSCSFHPAGFGVGTTAAREY